MSILVRRSARASPFRAGSLAAMRRRCPGTGEATGPGVLESFPSLDPYRVICPACGESVKFSPVGRIDPHSVVVVSPPRPRKPLRRRGRKAEREAAAWAACRQAVLARSRGWCEAWRLGYSPVCLSALHGGVHVHHLFPEDRDAGRHDAARCALLCVASHDWAHQNPRAAAKAGLLRPDC
jgi:hypothetical protein